MAGYVVTGRATPRRPRSIGLTISNSQEEEEEEAIIQPGEDIDATSDMPSLRNSLNLMMNFKFV